MRIFIDDYTNLQKWNMVCRQNKPVCRGRRPRRPAAQSAAGLYLANEPTRLGQAPGPQSPLAKNITFSQNPGAYLRAVEGARPCGSIFASINHIGFFQNPTAPPWVSPGAHWRGILTRQVCRNKKSEAEPHKIFLNGLTKKRRHDKIS